MAASSSACAAAHCNNIEVYKLLLKESNERYREKHLIELQEILM